MPGAYPAPGAPAARRPSSTPFYVGIPNMLGGFWDVFPWIGLVLYVGQLWSIFGNAPGIIVLIATIGLMLWGPLYLFWIICDVLYTRSGWWWILLGVFCYPIGLFLYLMTGRQV